MKDQSNFHLQSKGILLCLTAAIIWGIAFPIMTLILNKVDVFMATLVRFGGAAPFFYFLLIKKEGLSALKIPHNKKLLLWFFGSCGFAGFGFLSALGMHMIGKHGAINASVISATMPLISIIVNFFLRRKKPAAFSLIFILLSFLGVILVITKGNISNLINSPSEYLADLILILGASCWVLYTIGAEFFPDYSSMKYTSLTILYGAITIIIVNLIFYFKGVLVVPDIANLKSIFLELIYMAIISGFIGVLCWNSGNKILTPINGVLFINAVPITSFIVSTFFGVIPTLFQIFGALITIMALFLNNFFQRRS